MGACPATTAFECGRDSPDARDFAKQVAYAEISVSVKTYVPSSRRVGSPNVSQAASTPHNDEGDQ